MNAIRSADRVPQLAGAEFGAAIAGIIDFYRAGKVDDSLQHFITDLREAFTLLTVE